MVSTVVDATGHLRPSDFGPLFCPPSPAGRHNPSTRRRPSLIADISSAGAVPIGPSRSALPSVTSEVTLTTASSGRPDTAAGRNTLPGIVANVVFDVITAVNTVGSRLSLYG